ncbi:drug/metabolite transporter (DMT)-like permease [Constrictibacter sp. MBR-5]|jgi:drug/metabolite transporter (DMT)-like permease|uniref:EamA family transporter n=1 Tax=Constrictibacter sp. MBR-5 TaxID=3156467 RepID=UPI0033926302
MELWIPITVFAAFCQNLRSALQKHLKGRLSTSGATFSRFVYAVPFAWLYLAGVAQVSGDPLPDLHWTFAGYAAVGGLAQIAATALLVYLFSFRNFTVGTTYSKTETVQTALIGALVIGDAVSTQALAAILISLAGVIALSVARTELTARRLLTSWLDKPALIGLASGAFFGVSAVSYRAASLSLDSGNFAIRAAFTLAFVLILQTVVMAVYMRIREPGQLTAVARSWRVSIWVGVSGMAASAGWFTAMTIENAAHVRALGQIELVFTFIASVMVFRERTNPTEIVGILLVIGGILVLLL